MIRQAEKQQKSTSSLERDIVLFELLGPAHLPFVIYYLLSGKTIMFYEIKSGLKGFGLIKSAIMKKMINEIKVDLDLEKRSLCVESSLNAVETIYEKTYSDNKLIRKLEVFLGSDKVRVIYKKLLAERLWKMQVCVNYADRGGKIVFVPENSIGFAELAFRLNRNHGAKNEICVPVWAKLYGRAREAKKKVLSLISLGLLPIRIVLKIKSIGSINKRAYQLGIRLYRHDFGLHLKYRSMDFLLDDKLNKDKVVFSIEEPLADDYQKELDARGYVSIEPFKLLGIVSWKFLNEIFIGKFLRGWSALISSSLLSDSFTVKNAALIMHHYLVWERFVAEYKLKHYAVYNDDMPYHVIRNIVLSQNGVQTWYYVHSCHFIDVFTPTGQKSYRSIGASYLYYDKLICWGRRMKQYHESHQTCISDYVEDGCLWSEHVRNADESSGRAAMRDNIVKTAPQKIIAIFDTTFGLPGSILSLNDMRLFIEGILKLLADQPALGVIFKKKWRWEEFLELLPEAALIYRDLHEHPRCYTTGEDEKDPAETIAVSDLVISACFTSPTMEALGARKKGIYFDSSERFRGCYYDAFPKLVAHNYNELKEFVDYWLYKITDKEYDDYLQYRVKGELDYFVDGQAISRFRQALLLNK